MCASCWRVGGDMCVCSSDLVDILQRKAEGEIVGPLGGHDGIQSLQEDGALVPLHLVGPLDEVVAVPAGNGDERDGLALVADLGQEPEQNREEEEGREVSAHNRRVEGKC